MYQCRPVNRDDFAPICTFPMNEEELFYMFPKANFPLTPEQIEESVKSRLKPTVVIDTKDNTAAGFANFYGLEEGACCWLGNVIVSPAHRGKGASTFLVKSMMNIARNELNVPKLQLVCHNTNLVALLLYTKLGFKPFGIKTMENKYGETFAGIKMEIDLCEGI